MSTETFLTLFKKYSSISLFHVNDLALMMGKKKSVLRVELTRLVKRGIIQSIAKGYYSNPFNPPSTDRIAMTLKKPSYISMETALNRQGILPQTVYMYTLITTGMTYTFKTLDCSYEYHHIQNDYYFGFQANSKGIYFADPEKALLDLIYLRFKGGNAQEKLTVRSLLDDMEHSLLRKSYLKKYAKKMNLTAYLKKSFPDFPIL